VTRANGIADHKPDKRESDRPDPDKLNQKQLFDKIRKGVVAITVTAHVILEKYVNEKVWFGTGFVVDLSPEDALIVTNAHVAGEMSVCTYDVKFGDGRTAVARLVYTDPCYDFAILSVNKNDVPSSCIALECSDKDVEQNQTVHSMGNSACNEFSVYTGSVFDTRRILWLKLFPEQSFQFTNLTVGGASGSPVFNDYGKVVGLLYGGKLISGAALPISYIVPVVRSVRSKKEFKSYFIGCILDYASAQDLANAGTLTQDAANEHNVRFPDSNNRVIVVSKNLAAYGADKTPLEPGDAVWSVNGKMIGAELKLINSIIQDGAGEDVIVEVYRKGTKRKFKVPVHRLSSEPKLRLLSFAGTTFFETNDEIRAASGKASRGVFIADSEPGSPFMEITSSSGKRNSGNLFQITRLGDRKISSLNDVAEAVQDLRDKKVFIVKYMSIGGDAQETSTIVKQVPEFVNATFYTFNHETREWEVHQLKK
jgi:S1-C subfamily serine protease